MNSYYINFNELSTSKQDDIRNTIRMDIESELSVQNKEADSLTIEEMVDKAIRLTFNCVASVEIDTEYLFDSCSEDR